MENLIEKINKLILFFIIYSIVFVVFFSTLGYTLPFVLAIGFAMVLKNPTRFLVTKFKLKSSIASLITTILFFAIIITSVLWIATALTSEIIQLTKNLSSFIQSQSQYIYSLFGELQKYYNGLDPSFIKSLQDSLSSSVSGIVKGTTNLGMTVVSSVLAIVSSVPYLIMVIMFTLIATYFFTRDFSQSQTRFIKSMFSKESERIIYVYNEAKKMLFNYLKSYLLVIFITFAITLFGFAILRVKYALVLSLVCAFFDVLPVLGISIIYLPMAAIYLIGNKLFTGIGLIVLYALVSVVRQIAEPRIVSSSLGLHPVAVLAAIFIGLKANGVSGMFFCIFLVVFYKILKKVEVL